MATNPIGPGTCNLSVNVPTEWRSILGRIAFRKGKSMGAIVRRLFARAFCFASKAQKADLDAITVLRAAIADGVGPDDKPAIEQAIALVARSAKLDGALTSGLDLTPKAEESK